VLPVAIEAVIFVGEQLEQLTWDVHHIYVDLGAEALDSVAQWVLRKAQHFVQEQHIHGPLLRHL
tara:strand:- start:384 stop:575 length:192 start_codon:yes stop_codon:yes gene_type:complete